VGQSDPDACARWIEVPGDGKLVEETVCFPASLPCGAQGATDERRTSKAGKACDPGNEEIEQSAPERSGRRARALRRHRCAQGECDGVRQHRRRRGRTAGVPDDKRRFEGTEAVAGGIGGDSRSDGIDGSLLAAGLADPRRRALPAAAGQCAPRPQYAGEKDRRRRRRMAGDAAAQRADPGQLRTTRRSACAARSVPYARHSGNGTSDCQPAAKHPTGNSEPTTSSDATTSGLSSHMSANWKPWVSKSKS
jgi:hypothetical protein